MKQYINPEMEWVTLSQDDVIATSGLTEAMGAFGFGNDQKDQWAWS